MIRKEQVEQHMPQLLSLRILDAVDELLEEPGICRDNGLSLSRQLLPCNGEIN